MPDLLNKAKNNFAALLREVFDTEQCSKIRVLTVDSANGTESDHVLAMYHRRRSDAIDLGGIQRDELRFYEAATRERNSLTVLLDEDAFQASVAARDQHLWTNLNRSGYISEEDLQQHEEWANLFSLCHQKGVNWSTWHGDSNVNDYVERMPLPIFIAGLT